MGKWGVGMPVALKLELFGELVYDAFGEYAYQVGSSLTTTSWRDVDVRLILADEDYASYGFGNPAASHMNAKWVAYCLAFSAIGRELTGLPIDFQIQQCTAANEEFHNHSRSALGIHRHLMRSKYKENT